MGSGTHCSNIDGFLGTHGTHANGATALASVNFEDMSFGPLVFQWLRWHGFRGFLGTHQYLSSGFRNPSILSYETLNYPFYEKKPTNNYAGANQT